MTAGAPNPLRVAVIGAGWASELHLQAYAASPDVETVAICSRTRSTAEQVAERFSVPRVHTDMAELFANEQLDVVSIATPPASHAEWTIAAAEHGCHVLCDKPIALTTSEAERMLRAVDDRGVRHATGFIWRNDPGIKRLRTELSNGTVGRIREVRCRCPLGAPVLPMTWMYDADAGGGSLMQHGQHIIDRVRWLTGEEIVEVGGQLLFDVEEAVIGPEFHNVFEAFGWAARHGRDTAALPKAKVTADTGYDFAGRLGSGIRVHFWEAMHSTGIISDQIEVYGTAGTLVWAAGGGLTIRRPGPHAKPEPIDVVQTSAAGAGDLRAAEEAGHQYWRELAQAFADDILGRESTPYSTLLDGLRVQQVVDAVRESTQTRSWTTTGAIG
jgi:predicted dehydrogenase